MNGPESPHFTTEFLIDEKKLSGMNGPESPHFTAGNWQINNL